MEATPFQLLAYQILWVGWLSSKQVADGGQAIPVARVSDIMGGLVKQVVDGGLVRFPNCLTNGGHAGAADADASVPAVLCQCRARPQRSLRL